jgi:hypothetical protein
METDSVSASLCRGAPLAFHIPIAQRHRLPAAAQWDTAQPTIGSTANIIIGCNGQSESLVSLFRIGGDKAAGRPPRRGLFQTPLPAFLGRCVRLLRGPENHHLDPPIFLPRISIATRVAITAATTIATLTTALAGRPT